MTIEAPYGDECAGCEHYQKIKDDFEGLCKATGAQDIATTINCRIAETQSAIVSWDAIFRPSGKGLTMAGGIIVGTPPKFCPLTKENNG